MIKKILLENFKAFKFAEIEIKPITILVGPNNGGKTSLLQSISLIQQTLGGSSDILRFKSEYMDLGDFDNIVHQNSKEKEIRFRFDFDEEYLFNWDEIPGYLFNWDEIAKKVWFDIINRGKEEYRLIKFLKAKFGLEWLDPVSVIIRKIGNKTLLVKGTFVWPPYPQNYILISLNDTNTKAILTISTDERSDEFVVKAKNGKLIIYTQDSNRLIEFLSKNFDIIWAREAEIEKIDSGKTISVSTIENSLSLTLNDDNTKAILTIDDGRTDELSVKIENDLLNIYDKSKYFDTKIKKESSGKLFVKDFSCNDGVFEYSLTDIEKELDYYKPREFKINYERLADKNIILPEESFKLTFYRENFFFKIRPTLFEKGFTLREIIKEQAQEDFIRKILDSAITSSSDFNQNIKTKFEKIRYIGPIRNVPEKRYYSVSGSHINYVGRKGEFAPNMIEGVPKIQEKIQNTLRIFEIANSLEILKFKPQKMFEFKLKTNITDNAVNFIDLGCGTSQILPLLVQCLFQSLYSQDGSITVIEQPEVHLHPKLQADFASFLVEHIESKNKFLIETHSEYFIERLRTNILRNPSLAEDVIIYYIEQNKDKKRSEIIKIEINSEGQFSSLPEGYFTNFRLKEMGTQMDLTLSRLKEGINSTLSD